MSSAVVVVEEEKVRLRVSPVQIYRNIVGPFEDNITRLDISKEKLEWLRGIALKASELVSQKPSPERPPPLGDEPDDPKQKQIYTNIMLPIATNALKLKIMPEDLHWLEPKALKASSVEADRLERIDNQIGIIADLDRILLETAKRFPENEAIQKSLAQGSSNIRREIEEIRSEAIKDAQSSQKQVSIHLVPDADDDLAEVMLQKLGTSNIGKRWRDATGPNKRVATNVPTNIADTLLHIYERRSGKYDIYLALGKIATSEIMSTPEYQNP